MKAKSNLNNLISNSAYRISFDFLIAFWLTTTPKVTYKRIMHKQPIFPAFDGQCRGFWHNWNQIYIINKDWKINIVKFYSGLKQMHGSNLTSKINRIIALMWARTMSVSKLLTLFLPKGIIALSFNWILKEFFFTRFIKWAFIVSREMISRTLAWHRVQKKVWISTSKPVLNSDYTIPDFAVQFSNFRFV